MFCADLENQRWQNLDPNSGKQTVVNATHFGTNSISLKT